MMFGFSLMFSSNLLCFLKTYIRYSTQEFDIHHMQRHTLPTMLKLAYMDVEVVCSFPWDSLYAILITEHSNCITLM